MQKDKSTRQRLDRLIDALLPIVAVLLAFAVGAVILLLQGVNPIEVSTDLPFLTAVIEQPLPR